MTFRIDEHPDGAALLAALDGGDDSVLPMLADLLEEAGVVSSAAARAAPVYRRVRLDRATDWMATLRNASPRHAGGVWRVGYFDSRTRALIETARAYEGAATVRVPGEHQ